MIPSRGGVHSALGSTGFKLLLPPKSPEAVRKHLGACLDRIGPAAEPSELLGVAKNNAEDNAFTLFKSLVTAGWKDLLGEQLSDSQLIRFRVLSQNCDGRYETRTKQMRRTRLRTIGTSILESNESHLLGGAD